MNRGIVNDLSLCTRDCMSTSRGFACAQGDLRLDVRVQVLHGWFSGPVYSQSRTSQPEQNTHILGYIIPKPDGFCCLFILNLLERVAEAAGCQHRGLLR